MKRADELVSLFSDARLEPDKRFVRGLRKQLVKPKRQFGLRTLVPLTAASGVALAVLGLAIMQQAPVKESKGAKPERTVLLSKLYGMAMADSLPEHTATTFWSVLQSTTTGPQAAACNVNIEGATTPSKPVLLFRDGAISASWGHNDYDGSDSMRYSEDSEMPAFDADVLAISKNAQFGGVLSAATLTDRNGKPLPSNIATALKATGSYDLYATYATKLPDGTDPMPGCPIQFIHLKVDAASGMFTEYAEYNGPIRDTNLAFKATQTIQTATGNFAANLPKFTAVGFNLEQARAQQAKVTTAHVINTAAGYEFLYFRSVLGMDSMTEIKAPDGGVAAYAYHFAKQPGVLYRMYTARTGNQQPKDIAALKAMAQAKGWRVLTDQKQTVGPGGFLSPNLETYVVTDGVTQYGMVATGKANIPYVYAQAPRVGLSLDFLLTQVQVTQPGY